MLDPDPHKTDADPKHWFFTYIRIRIRNADPDPEGLEGAERKEKTQPKDR
jgi:hypothetical protein